MTTLQDMLAKRRAARAASVSRPALHFGTGPIPESPNPAPLRVVILTYDRPMPLLELLQDIVLHRGKHEISVAVYDDGSGADYGAVEAFLTEQGWEYVRASQNHGKRRFWQWVSRIYGLQAPRTEQLFVLLPDDVRLCSRFFDRVLGTWSRITDTDKVALNLLRDDSRDGNACWTNQKPMDCGPVFDVGWVDGAILCNRRYFEALDWKLEEVDAARWRLDPTASSGVGQQLSLRLYRQRLGMYGVKRSLIAHVAGPSQMNPIERRKNPLMAMHFIDGTTAHRVLTGATPKPKAQRVQPKTVRVSSSGARKIR